MTDCRASIVKIVLEDLTNNESIFEIISALSVLKEHWFYVKTNLFSYEHLQLS